MSDPSWSNRVGCTEVLSLTSSPWARCQWASFISARLGSFPSSCTSLTRFISVSSGEYFFSTLLRLAS